MNEIRHRIASRKEELLETVFAKSIPWRQTCAMIRDLISVTADSRCLQVIGRHDTVGLTQVFSKWLTGVGGKWEQVEVPLEAMATLGSSSLAGPVSPYTIPHPDETFDLLLLVDLLEHIPDDQALIAEGHRVLKPAGRLVLVVRQTRRWSLLRPLRRLLGVTARCRGRARPGYTESGLFDVLKDGFDVEEARPYSRFFTQVVQAFSLCSIRRSGVEREMAAAHSRDDERTLMAYRRLARSARTLYPLAWLASKLDLLLFASHGHYFAMTARRRQWRSRRAPALKDGRSIAEATINTKIGTAAPF